MGLRLELRARRPRWFEKKWKPKKPILYIIEQIGGKWVNTYWWGGNWRRERIVEFCDSGTVDFSPHLFVGGEWLVIGRSGTTLTVNGVMDAEIKIKSLNPNISEWTCFGKISGLGLFGAKVLPFDLEEKIKES